MIHASPLEQRQPESSLNRVLLHDKLHSALKGESTPEVRGVSQALVRCIPRLQGRFFGASARTYFWCAAGCINTRPIEGQ